MRYIVEVASEGMTHVINFVNIGYRIQIILTLLPEQFQRL
jgi:hypothetical protein